MSPSPAPRAGLTALAARDEIARGSLAAQELTESCLARIAEREAEVQAWAFFDPDHALKQAQERDRGRASGRPIGLLHGLPVGVKDIVDTTDFPTENGTPIDAGRRPASDAALVERLRAAGAIILGKTVTTELAAFTPGKTRNPHDPQRTPGGSSSGSAAAVAAGMAPLAVGSQTNGSVIRPASFCGVIGYKPSRGLISRRGMLTQSQTMDTAGVFATSVEDAALLADALVGFDPADPAMRPQAHPGLLAQTMAARPLPPLLAFVRSPVWGDAEADVEAGFAELAAALGERMQEVSLSADFGKAHRWHAAINMAELAYNFAPYAGRGWDLLSERMRGMIDEGRRVATVDYLAAQSGLAKLADDFDELFLHFDAIATPAACGEAPVGEATGSPAFSTIWTACGAPCITLPLLQGGNGLPIGVQLVGRRGFDGRLLSIARWLTHTIAAA